MNKFNQIKSDEMLCLIAESIKQNPVVTCWYKYNKSKDEYIFNHIEDGYSFEDKPIPKSEKFTAQNDWKNYKWMRTFGQLTKDGLIELPNSKYTTNEII